MPQVKAPDTIPLAPEAFAPRIDTSVCWLAGGGFFINARGTILLLDPVLATRAPRVCETGLPLLVDYPIDVRDAPRVDAVLYTHADDDHLAPVTAKKLANICPLFLGSAYVCRTLADLGAAPETRRACKPGETLRIGSCEITITPADHGWQMMHPEKFPDPFGLEDCLGFIVKTPDGALFFPGDTRLMKEHLSIGGIDVLAMDASRDAWHLGVENSAKLANHLKDALLIPYHYGTFDQPEHTAHNGDPAEALALTENAERRVRRLAPGQMLRLRHGKEA